MKKRILIVISLCLSIITLFLCAACAPKLTKNARLSELRDNIFIGETDAFKITAVTGTRENPFSINGHSQKEKINFTVITLAPKGSSSAAEFSYKATVGQAEYTGKLTRHPYNQTYSAEIAVLTQGGSIEVTIAGHDPTTLESVKTENYISGEKAFLVAQSRLKKSVNAKAKEREYEIFVRLIENPINSGGGYFWYVAFVFEDDTTYAALIEPVSIEIVAIKE